MSLQCLVLADESQELGGKTSPSVRLHVWAAFVVQRLSVCSSFAVSCFLLCMLRYYKPSHTSSISMFRTFCTPVSTGVLQSGFAQNNAPHNGSQSHLDATKCLKVVLGVTIMFLNGEQAWLTNTRPVVHSNNEAKCPQEKSCSVCYVLLVIWVLGEDRFRFCQSQFYWVAQRVHTHQEREREIFTSFG